MMRYVQEKMYSCLRWKNRKNEQLTHGGKKNSIYIVSADSSSDECLCVPVEISVLRHISAYACQRRSKIKANMHNTYILMCCGQLIAVVMNCLCVVAYQ